MYLARVFLNPVRRGSRKLLSSPHAMHAAVLAGFPPGAVKADGDGPRVLWRVDEIDRHRTVLYVVSPIRPDLEPVVEQAGWATEEGAPQVREYGPLLDALAEGQAWRFRLTANPTYRRAEVGGRPGKVLGHVTASQQLDWLLERARGAGFNVPLHEGQPLVNVIGREVKTFQRGASRVTLATATYQGQLEVTDAGALRRTLVTGLGRGKGYGCGLLTLARA